MPKTPTIKKPPKKSLKRPKLTRLGTLAEMTQGMNGVMIDGGSGMSKI